MGDGLFSLKGTTALLTGAAGGLGKRFAQVLTCAGAKVALAGRHEGTLQPLAKDLQAAGAEVAVTPLDVTDAASIQRGFDAAEKALGPISLLINNSGVAAAGMASEIPEGEWDRVLDTNLKGAWLCSGAFARQRIATGEPGVIVNIASILGLRTAGGVAAYGASKAALIQLTQNMAFELARHRIRVNALAPGYISTDINREFLETPAGQALVKRVPQRRLGNPGDLDGPLLLLASDASRFMTGTVIPVDGGHLVSTL